MRESFDAPADNVSAIRQVATARIPTRFGEFTAHAFVAADGAGAREHLACVLGDIGNDPSEMEAGSEPVGRVHSEEGSLGRGRAGQVGGEPVLVRVHSECITGDVLGSQRCDCGAQLEMAMEIIGTAGRGVLLYLRNHEGRGIGLTHKLRAYELQDDGHDTVEANLHQGLPIDARDYAIAAQMLAHLGVRNVRLLTNNPAKLQSLADMGIAVSERVPLQTLPSMENSDYLRTKRDKLGHLLGDLDDMTLLRGSDVAPLENSEAASASTGLDIDADLLAVLPLDNSESESHPFPATTHVAPVSSRR